MAIAENDQSDDQTKQAVTSTNATALGVSSQSSTNKDGQKITTTSSASESFPGARLANPLSNLSSYTYGLVLYMVTPEVMNGFIASGGTLNGVDKLGGSIITVAQSGGINNSIEKRIKNNTSELKTENGGEGLDYYIDDLTINTLLPGGANKATTSTEIKFKIIEPTSFTFLQDIAKAAVELNSQSGLLKGLTQNQPNGFNQNYILGIKFYGYDVDGNLVTSSNPQFVNEKYKDAGYSDQNSIINRYFAIKMSNMKFKLDGKIVTYHCEALVVSEHAAFSQTNGTIKNPLTISGSTVEDVLQGGQTKGSKGLMRVLSDENEGLKDKNVISIPNTYSIEFLDETGKVDPNSPIAKAGLVDDATFVNSTAPTSNVQSTDKVNIADSFKANSFDPKRKSISVAAGQNLLSVIDNIIVKSNYVTKALTEISSQTVEAKTLKAPTGQTLKWYSVNPVIKIKGIDQKTNSWAYDIKYQVRPYDIPYIRSIYTNRSSKYPGPFKMYHYWLTGLNSEVISYEQTYDNLFYTVASMSTSADTVAGNGKQGSAPSLPQNAVKSDDTTGGQNKGSEINNNVRAQLYSPGDQSQAKIKILGDPDYIMQSIGVNSTSSASKFYGKGKSISPFGGQVFIQMAFNTASDYKNDGTLDVTSNLQFYKTDKVKAAGIDGIVYMVTQVDSTFSRGTFTQVLDCLMVDESQLVTKDTQSADNESQSQAETNRLASKAANAGSNVVNNERPTSATPVSNTDTRDSTAQTDSAKNTAPESPTMNVINNAAQHTVVRPGPLDDTFKATPQPTSFDQAYDA